MKIIPVEFNGAAMQFNDAGWFNATRAAERFGKAPHDWLRLPDTEHYIQALSEANSNTGKSRIWVQTKRGNNGGTWLHPKLAILFARWLDTRFAVWCDQQIERIMRSDPPSALRHQCTAANKLMNNVLHDSRQAEQKGTQAHHYCNEALLINEVVTGLRMPLDRDTVPLNTLDELEALQIHNAKLMLQGKPYAERKALLIAFMANLRSIGAIEQGASHEQQTG